ncbi:uncharacterized protein LAJ45_07747 [Morchella importuna]|uniref:uncharacterized protein n=1 Tax=Morchella importuna TaxID=1174673 RepID=UPI001E8DA1E1|nr:uncharacterized protein LAJ45_07747 [Morchella importuna]KAH8148294.1 hypothetical protein LAJ45_07747 [Morchella importuna]
MVALRVMELYVSCITSPPKPPSSAGIHTHSTGRPQHATAAPTAAPTDISKQPPRVSARDLSLLMYPVPSEEMRRI